MEPTAASRFVARVTFLLFTSANLLLEKSDCLKRSPPGAKASLEP
jgi:hypothetical protein